MKNFKNNVEETKAEVVSNKPLNGLRTAIVTVVCVLFGIFGILYSNNGNNIVGEGDHELKTVSEMPVFTTVSTTPITTTRCTTNTTVVTTSVTTTAETTVTTTAEPENVIVLDEPRLVFEEPAYEESVVEEQPQEPIIEEPVIEEPVTEPPVEEPQPVESEECSMTYLGNLKITGYVATGNPTASGCYPYVGGVAMSRSYGLPWGTTIYIDGLGYYTLNDCGCSYGVVDVFCDSISECYDLTSWRDVYIVN